MAAAPFGFPSRQGEKVTLKAHTHIVIAGAMSVTEQRANTVAALHRRTVAQRWQTPLQRRTAINKYIYIVLDKHHSACL